MGNYTTEKSYWGRVEDINYKQATYEVAVTDGASDLGGQVCSQSKIRILALTVGIFEPRHFPTACFSTCTF